MIHLEKSLRSLFEDMAANGLWDWQLLEEVKRLHRFNKLGQKMHRLMKNQPKPEIEHNHEDDVTEKQESTDSWLAAEENKFLSSFSE